MKRGGNFLPLLFAAGAIILAACIDVPGGDDDLLSLELNRLSAPSIVVGDTLRDSTGAATRLSVTAFNYNGGVIADPDVRYSNIDRRARVDSITGVVIGDSAGTTTRVFARIGDVVASVQLPVVLRPDTVVGSNARDSLSYSLADTTVNVSNPLGVRVLHGLATTDSAVASYLVSFQIISPADTALARLVDQNGRPSARDTTDATGVAGRRVKLNVLRLVNPVDSILVRATVRYKGVNVRGSPMTLVLKVKPR